jgi:hypothetical protein
MTDWRLAADTTDEMTRVLSSGVWTSDTDKDLGKLSPGDRAVLFVLKGKGQGYWGLATVSSDVAPGADGRGYQIELDVHRRRDDAVPPAKVSPILKQARLRVRYLPLYVQELSPPEYQVMSRFI